MKKWLYYIIPIVGIGAFLIVYFSHVEEAKLRTAAHKAEVARITAAETAKKKALEDRARIDAENKAKERADAEAAKEADRTAKWLEQGQKVQDEMDEAIKSSSESTAKIAAMEKEMARLRNQRDSLNRELIETARACELAKIARRTAELELQRQTAFIVKKADESALAVPPALAPAK
jgi:chromosome segregation ATPase